MFHVVAQDGFGAELRSQARLADGHWHHLIAESDREARTLAVYVDGKLDSRGPGLGKISIANAGDLCVGGSPEGLT